MEHTSAFRTYWSSISNRPPPFDDGELQRIQVPSMLVGTVPALQPGPVAEPPLALEPTQNWEAGTSLVVQWLRIH